uniref:Uncharacterized protein n=1 Tax=Arundo donax TaxID=35708 RepID=A0A0A9HDP1_ARUDO
MKLLHNFCFFFPIPALLKELMADVVVVFFVLDRFVGANCRTGSVLLHHLLKLHHYHEGWSQCAVISVLAVLLMCHFSFLVVHRLALMISF